MSYNDKLAYLCRKGREDLSIIKSDFYRSIADSAYNRNELVGIGYSNVEILPIIIDFKDLEGVIPNPKISSKLEGKKNILFVGKIAPHKAQKDLVNIFYYYHKYIDSDSRLIMIGSYDGFERYHNELCAQIETLGLSDVIITGSIPFEDLIAYYRSADLFLCASEHEGFCVPIVEAMNFKVPILAYGSAAIPDTLKGAGIIFQRKRELYDVAEMMHLMLTDRGLRDRIIEKQNRVLSIYNSKELENRFKKIVGL
jgi:glycosyltransferase involved in cell wall biosynthesis